MLGVVVAEGFELGVIDGFGVAIWNLLRQRKLFICRRSTFRHSEI